MKTFTQYSHYDFKHDMDFISWKMVESKKERKSQHFLSGAPDQMILTSITRQEVRKRGEQTRILIKISSL